MRIFRQGASVLIPRRYLCVLDTPWTMKRTPWWRRPYRAGVSATGGLRW